MIEELTVGDRVTFRDDADGPVYRVLAISAAGICRLRHEEGGFDTPPVDISHLTWVVRRWGRFAGRHEHATREATNE